MQPEDAAKGVNLRPPEFFVASSASQRNIHSSGGHGSAVKRTVIPPVVIVSYGSMSTPTAHHFHHGAYALAQPDAFQVSYDNPPAGHARAQKHIFKALSYQPGGNCCVHSQWLPDIVLWGSCDA